MNYNNIPNSLPSLYPCPSQGSFVALTSKVGLCFPMSWIGAGLMTCFGQYRMQRMCQYVPRQGLKRHGLHLPFLPNMWTSLGLMKDNIEGRPTLLSQAIVYQPIDDRPLNTWESPAKISRATDPSHGWPQMHVWAQQDQLPTDFWAMLLFFWSSVFEGDLFCSNS